MESAKKASGRAVGGKARMDSLTAEERKENSRKAVAAREAMKTLPKATHFGTLPFAEDMKCFVLDDGRRVISGRGMTSAIGMKGRGDGVVRIAEHKLIRDSGDLTMIEALTNPVKFIGKSPKGSAETSDGFEAQVLQQVCEAILTARDNNLLVTEQDFRYAQHADILIRGFARIGIIALIDEATGYQRERERDALAKILEAFVAKELQPWVKTFPPEFYEHLFRLYKVPYPPEKANFRPRYFGHITNNVIYDRLAPHLLPELKAAASKQEKRVHLHRLLTQDVGHPKLREHVAGITALLRISKTREQFRAFVDQAYPQFGSTGMLDFGDDFIA